MQTEQREEYYRQRIGKQYGDFIVTDVWYNEERHTQVWEMRCVHCGKTRITNWGKEYVKGRAKGICQCQKSKPVKISPKKQKRPLMKDHPLHRTWCGIKVRCYRERDKDYCNYGARGIGMCEEWRNDFWAFAKWAEENGWQPGLTIERIENSKGYSPENCKWIPRGDQNKNKRNVPLYEGKTRPELCEEAGVRVGNVETLMGKGMDIYSAVERAKEIKRNREFIEECHDHNIKIELVRNRMKRGIPKDQALRKGRIGHYNIDGVMMKGKEIEEKYGITMPAVYYRMRVKGMSFEEALTAAKEGGRR